MSGVKEGFIDTSQLPDFFEYAFTIYGITECLSLNNQVLFCYHRTFQRSYWLEYTDQQAILSGKWIHLSFEEVLNRITDPEIRQWFLFHLDIFS